MFLNQSFQKKGLFLFALALLCLVMNFAVMAAPVPKYIFMFIGDGMGLAQRQVTELMLNTSGVYGPAKDQKHRLVMNSLEVSGINTTYDSTSVVPDSASTATSLSSGYKTLSGVIGMREDKKTVTPYITEALKKKGYAIGVISTVKIVHATPAAYYAHIDSRNKYDEIADQMINSGFDLFVGGGGNKHFDGSIREDKRDLYQEAAANKGFTVVKTGKDFLATKPGQKVLANLPGDLFDEALPYAIDRQADDLSLTQIVAKSIEILSSNKKGFFMAIEEGKVDWACHANDTGAVIGNMLDFDKAIAVALEFKKKNPNTLIVVTGDHECGGLGLSMGNDYRVNPELFFDQKISFEIADAKVAAILKLNDSSEKIFGVAEEFGLTNLTNTEKAQIQKAVADQKAKLSKGELNHLYGGYQPITMTFRRLFNIRANLFWTSYAHTGIPVMTTASGAGAEKFAGYMDNTDVCKRLNEVAKAGLKWQ